MELRRRRSKSSKIENERKWSLGKAVRLPIPEFRPAVAEQGPELNSAELESVMASYARPLDDYLEMFIQFGYVLLFSPVFPLAGLCALANNLLEIRVDAFKLCNAVQRPFARRVASVGAWQRAMELMGVAGVLVNCALIGQSGLVQRLWPRISFGGQILLVVVLEHLILMAKTALDLAIPDIPEWIRLDIAKKEHCRREAFNRDSKLLSTPAQPSSPIDKQDKMENSQQIQSSKYGKKKRSMTPQCRPIDRSDKHLFLN